MAMKLLHAALIFAASLFAPFASAQSLNDAYFEEMQNLSLSENITSPKVPERSHASLKSSMHSLAVEIAKRGYKVETMRKGEVVIVTIPTDNLFAPNDTLLIDGAAERHLAPITAYLNRPGKYKFLLAVHSDDTGSEEYTIDLTTKRVEALYAWFDARNSSSSRYVFGYPMGDTSPILPNNTRANRAANRRLEIYIVPLEF